MIFGIATYRANVLRRAAILTVVGGIAGILALSPPFQIPLALAVGWLGYSLLRPATQDSARAITTAPLVVPGTVTEAATKG